MTELYLDHPDCHLIFLLQCHILNAIWQEQLSLQMLSERAASTSKITQQLKSGAKAYQQRGHLHGQTTH